jgi:thioredoxin reductase (NADPH)
VIAGGGDSALDWTVFLVSIAERVTLIHRGTVFRGAPDMAEKAMEMAALGEIDLLLQSRITAVSGSGHLQNVTVLDAQGSERLLEADVLIPLFGLSPKLGPIAEWGLNLDQSAILVDPSDFSTNQPGIYAVGDINTYPGKLKLILCGFHEAALMAQSAFKRVYPDQKLTFKYTTVYGIPKG